jgi:hypothetical protein
MFAELIKYNEEQRDVFRPASPSPSEDEKEGFAYPWPGALRPPREPATRPPAR